MFRQSGTKVTKSVESKFQGWTLSTLYSLNTGLVVILSVDVLLECVVAANGYSVGDFANLSSQNGSGGTAGCSAAISGSFLQCFISPTGLGIRDKGTGIGTSLASSASFDLVLRAYGT